MKKNNINIGIIIFYLCLNIKFCISSVQASEKLNNGYSVCIFPEKQYTVETNLLNDFKHGVHTGLPLAVETSVSSTPPSLNRILPLT